MSKNQCWLGVGLMTLFAFGLGLPSALAQNGMYVFPPDNWSVSAAAWDPFTDDIMVVGTGISGFGEFVAASVSSSGTLNTAFGGGVVPTQVSSTKTPENWAYACAVQPADGKLLSGGFSSYAQGNGFALVRYNTNGKLDTTFNKTGIVTTNFSSNNETITAMALQGDGKIVVSGQSRNLSHTMITARYTTSGALDTSFGSGGTISVTIPAINGSNVNRLVAEAIALQSEGDIIVGAQAALANGGEAMVLIRYTPAGAIDTSFGSEGIMVYNVPGCGSSYLADIVVDSDNTIIIAGDSVDSNDNDYLTLVRSASDGKSLDTTMGSWVDSNQVYHAGPGYVRCFWDSPQNQSAATSVALQSNGCIVVSGWAPNNNLLVARFDEYGTPDNTFGDVVDVVNGVNVPQGYSEDFALSPIFTGHSILIQSDNKIVAVGQTGMVRYNSDGTVDESF